MGESRANPRSPAFRGNDLLGRDAMAIVDGRGRPLVEGDEVILHKIEMKAPSAVVESIGVNLAPGAPPRTMRMTLVTRLQIVVPANAPIPDILRIATRAETRALSGLPSEEEEPLLAGPSGRGPAGEEPTAPPPAPDAGAEVGVPLGEDPTQPHTTFNDVLDRGLLPDGVIPPPAPVGPRRVTED